MKHKNSITHFVPKSKFDLPVEIWGRILGNSDALCLYSCLTVCKIWRAFVEPLLFSAITVKSTNRLRGLASRVVHFHAHPEAMSWIRELRQQIKKPENELSHRDWVILVLTHARCLEIYHDEYPVTASLLSVLACNASATLRHLGLDVYLDDGLAFQVLHQLKLLQELRIGFINRNSSIQALEALSTLRLDHLTFLGISWPRDLQFPEKGGELLANMEIDNLDSIYLDIRHVHPAATLHLSRLLSGRKNDSANADIAFPETVLEALKGALLQNYRSLTLTSCTPSATFMDVWHVGFRCRNIYLEFSLKEDDRLWSVFTILAETAGSRFTDSNFTIRVRLRADEPVFTWGCSPPSTQYAAFVGRLMYHARVLNRSGIHVVDWKGYTVYDKD